MGSTLAIIGGYVLAGELSKVPRSDNTNNHTDQALQAYESKFGPFVEEHQKVPLEGNNITSFPGLIHSATT